MSQTLGEVASCSPSRTADSYIYTIAPTTSNGLAAITSADELLLVDLQNLQLANALYFADVPTGLTTMVMGDYEGTSIICAGRDGTIATFDVRSQKRASHFKQGNLRICSAEHLSHWTHVELGGRHTNHSISMLWKQCSNWQRACKSPGCR